MNISITPELEELIEKKVKSGMYHSASEVVREGLRLLREQDELKELRLNELRKEIQRGYNSAAESSAVEWNAEELKSRVRSRKANAKQNKA